MRTDAAVSGRPDDLGEHVRCFLDCGLMLDPWLGGMAEGHIEPQAQRLLDRSAREVAERYWREPYIPDLGPAPSKAGARGGLGHRAAERVLMSTAAVIAHDRAGRITISPPMAEEAARRLTAFIGRRGFRALVWVYITINRFEHLGALRHYGGMPEEEFLRGRHRRPWVGTLLDEDLRHGIADGDFDIVTRKGRRWVEETPEGEQHHAEARRVLAEAGFFEARLRIALFSEMNLMRDYDAVLRRILPGETAWRQSITAFAAPQPGSRLLDVGCGSGSQIFEGGLREAVGRAGDLVGLDPAVGALEQAQAKARRHRARNVRFVRGFAEALPFSDGVFDMALGVAVLHLADVPRAMAEMIRVTRPGGVVVQAVLCGPEAPPAWLMDWLGTVLARAAELPSPHVLPTIGTAPGWFAAAGLEDVQAERHDVTADFEDPEAGALLALRTLPSVQNVLGSLPWTAAQDLVADITRRARTLFPSLSPTDRSIVLPIEVVRGRVPEGQP